MLGAPSWDVQMELLQTTAHIHGMALERHQGRAGGGSGKVKSPKSWRCPRCGTGGSLQLQGGLHQGWRCWIWDGDAGLTSEPKPWNEGCCSCGFVLSRSPLEVCAQVGAGTKRMRVGGGRAAPSGGFAFPPTLHGEKLVVCFSLDVVMGFCFSGSSSSTAPSRGHSLGGLSPNLPLPTFPGAVG